MNIATGCAKHCTQAWHVCMCVCVIISVPRIVTLTQSAHTLSQNLILFSKDIYKYNEFDLVNWRWQRSIVQNS